MQKVCNFSRQISRLLTFRFKQARAALPLDELSTAPAALAAWAGAATPSPRSLTFLRKRNVRQLINVETLGELNRKLLLFYAYFQILDDN